MSIKDFSQKIKGLAGSETGKDVYIVITLILVAVAAFGLGRLSMARSGASPVSLVYPRDMQGLVQNTANIVKTSSDNTSSIVSSQTEKLVEGANSQPTELQKQIVASKKGTKYYYTWCSGAKSLSETNKIYFATEEEAEAKGYTKSTSCK
jgi:hypothetical protein